jgi:hypothetical protein
MSKWYFINVERGNIADKLQPRSINVSSTNNSNVSLDLVLQIGKIIHHDFSDSIKELSTFLKVNESPTAYENEGISADYWKDKCQKLLEELICC